MTSRRQSSKWMPLKSVLRVNGVTITECNEWITCDLQLSRICSTSNISSSDGCKSSNKSIVKKIHALTKQTAICIRNYFRSQVGRIWFNKTNTAFVLVWFLKPETSRVVSVLDSGAEGPKVKSQSWRCRVTVLGKLFTPIVPLFTKQQNW